MARLTHLALSNFRNFQDAHITPHPRFNLLFGKNGSGKTNLLEALFFLAIGKSQRGAHIADLVRFDTEKFTLKSEWLAAGNPRQVEAYGSAEKHGFSVNQAPLKSAAELVGAAPVVSFSPDDLQLISGPPSERRRTLNILLSQADISYFISLCDYNRTLAQRNAYLRSGAPDARYLSVLTRELIRLGADIRFKRQAFLDRLLPYAVRHLSAITDRRETPELTLRPAPAADAAGGEAALAAEFERARARETAFGVTLCGPHRDDLLVRLNGRDARRYASRGQLRSLSLSIKLAGVDLLDDLTGEPGVLLLDDMFSELDSRRSEALVATLSERHQIFAAVPKLPEFPLKADHAGFRVIHNVLEAL
ncbi:MAG: DNA replication/repair protein RecF [Fibrobacterota bacterium]